MNKKGLTLIEIIVSIALISIVMVFLFQIVITIKNANDRQNNSSNNKVSVLIITREVQKDLDSFGLENTPIANCDFDDNSNNIVPATASKVNCVKILYDSNNAKNNEGYILYYENNNKYFLAYKRGKGNVIETQTVREISVEPQDDLDINISKVGNDNDYSVKINLPIRDNENKYDLNLNYIYTKKTKNNVKIINEDGLAKNIKGMGKYYSNDIVNISFEYDSNVNQLQSVECINNLCQNSTNFSFTMPDEDVVVKINIKEDSVPPTCEATRGNGNYINGWDVTVTCSDVGSGCVEPIKKYTGIKQNQTFTVYDKVGNSNTCSIENIPVDSKAPTCTANTIGGSYTNGVTVKVTCEDGESGCKEANKTYDGIKQNQTFKVSDNVGNIGECKYYMPKYLNTYLTDLYSSSAGSNGLYKDNTSDQNIRYAGTNSKNYVIFGNTSELWRIIGIFNVTNSSGTTNKNVKIIRQSEIGKYSWDATGNDNWGINNWADSDLKTELNGDYLNYKLSSNKTNWYNSYWNSSNDTMTYSRNGVFNYQQTIKAQYQNLIENVVWNLGGGSTTTNISALTMYNIEKNGTVYSGMPGKWTGKIGLITASDYGYAANDSTCRNNLKSTACKNNNWLYNSDTQWLITQKSVDNTTVWQIQKDGSIFNNNAAGSRGVRPSLYLKKDVRVLSGTGTIKDPYILLV